MNGKELGRPARAHMGAAIAIAEPPHAASIDTDMEHSLVSTPRARQVSTPRARHEHAEHKGMDCDKRASGECLGKSGADRDRYFGFQAPEVGGRTTRHTRSSELGVGDSSEFGVRGSLRGLANTCFFPGQIWFYFLQGGDLPFSLALPFPSLLVEFLRFPPLIQPDY